MVAPVNAQQLLAEGGRLYDASSATTQPVAAPNLIQGAIEGSNVEPTLELTRMLKDEREFQFTTQFLQAESDREQSAIEKIGPKQS